MKALLPVAALCALAVASTTPASAARHVPCSAKGSHTVKRTHAVRVWYQRGHDRDGEPVLKYFGCLRSRGVAHFLAATGGNDFDGGTDVRTVKVAGRFTAVLEVSDAGCSRYEQCPPENPDGVSATVTVTDLRSGRDTHVVHLNDPPAAFTLTRTGVLTVR